MVEEAVQRWGERFPFSPSDNMTCTASIFHWKRVRKENKRMKMLRRRKKTDEVEEKRGKEDCHLKEEEKRRRRPHGGRAAPPPAGLLRDGDPLPRLVPDEGESVYA